MPYKCFQVSVQIARSESEHFSSSSIIFDREKNFEKTYLNLRKDNYGMNIQLITSLCNMSLPIHLTKLACRAPINSDKL